MPNVDVLHLLDGSPANMLHPATSLDDVYRTLSPEPLLTRDQVRAFYSDRLNTVRGDDKGARLALALNRAFGGSYYEAFLTYANLFKDLRTHLIFTIPITLGYSQQAAQLPFSSDRLVSIPDTPVFRSDHTEHTEGREAIRSVLEARIVPGLFEEGQMMRLIVASGGNLRDLFSLVTQATDNALLRQPPGKKIDRPDADSAIDSLRIEYTRRLGDSPYDREQIAYDDKAKRLVAIYNSDPNAAIPEAVLYSLLRSRAVQEFNGKGWFGVHPLVVDILKSQNRLLPSAPDGTD